MASRMNKHVVVFVSTVNMVAQVVEHELFFPPDAFVQVCPLNTLAVRVSLCNIPPIIKNLMKCGIALQGRRVHLEGLCLYRVSSLL